MNPQLFVAPLTAEQRLGLGASLRCSNACTVRRCQILLASADGHAPSRIARDLRCSAPTVHHAIHAFHRDGLGCLTPKSSRPHSARPALDASAVAPLQEILHQSPRLFGQPTSLWTLDRLADVCFAQGLSPRRLSGETSRVALKRLGISWQRAKPWITSPDPAYARKKKARDRLIRLAATHPDWVLGFQDETWWSRLAQPDLHAWASAAPLRLVERTADKKAPDPKALCCYGLRRGDTGGMLLRFVVGRPVSQVTEDDLGWVCERLAAEGKKALLLVWDNASWHISRRVRAWIKEHNRRAKPEGVRIVTCPLPSKSPWLNPIAPKWKHGKKAIVEPEGDLTGVAVQERVYAHYRCDPEPPLVQKIEKKVA